MRATTLCTAAIRLCGLMYDGARYVDGMLHGCMDVRLGVSGFQPGQTAWADRMVVCVWDETNQAKRSRGVLRLGAQELGVRRGKGDGERRAHAALSVVVSEIGQSRNREWV